ncbi:MAG: DUF1003 domain-containing protein [Candidatus Acidiferrales bacterium]
MNKTLADQIAENPTQYNIAAIARLEEEALGQRTRTERESDVIVKFIGSVKFLLLHLTLVVVWATLNLGLIPNVKAFDPFPFGILALFVASESVFLTICVLISQNRMARQAERRSHLDLQVGMLAEQELTMMLQMLQKLCQHAGVDTKSANQQVQGFSETTDVHKLASELEEKLPER